jgi:putative flippase GtrA
MSISELDREARSTGTERGPELVPANTSPAAIRDGHRSGLARSWETRWQPLMGRARSWPLTNRVAKYASTSVISTAISEVTLLVLYASHVAGAAEAAIAATVTGGVLSYVLSRYWIWPEADRSRAGRQLLWYWLIAFAGLVASTWVTGETASHADDKGVLRVAVVGLAYLATYATLWVVKFVLYQRFLFGSRASAA